MPEQRDRNLHHVVARPRNIEKRTEQHEQEDELHRHAERHTVYAFGGEPHMRHESLHGRALVLNYFGHQRPGKNINEKQAGGNQHAHAHRTARRLKHDCHANEADGHVHCRWLTRSSRQLVVIEVQIRRAKRADHSQYPIGPWHDLARRRPECREGSERQEDREGEVHRARLGIVEDPNTDYKRERRGVPDLEYRPRSRNHGKEGADFSRWLPAAQISLPDQLFEIWGWGNRASLSHAFASANKKGGIRIPPSSVRLRTGYLSQPFSL